MPGLAPAFIWQAASVFGEAGDLHRMVVLRHRNCHSAGYDEFETAEAYWIKLTAKAESLIHAVLCLDRSSLPPKSHRASLPLEFANDAAKALVEHRGNQGAIVDLIEDVHLDRLGWLAHHGLESLKSEWPSDIGDLLAWPDGDENAAADSRQPPPKGNDIQVEGEVLALALLNKHPEWTDTKIAKAVGINRTCIYRYEDFKRAKAILRSGRETRLRGIRTVDDDGLGDVEAVDPSST